MKVTTEPTIEPVGLAEVKDQIGIDSDDDSSDFVLERRITGARQWIENYLDRALINQTIEYRVDSFPVVFEVPWPSLVSVTTIIYVDDDGVEQTVSSADYVVDTFNNTIRPTYNTSWPVPRVETNAVRVVYVAGYGTAASDVPANIVDSIIGIVGHWTNYEQQIEHGGYITQVPSAIRKVLDHYRTRFL